MVHTVVWFDARLWHAFFWRSCYPVTRLWPLAGCCFVTARVNMGAVLGWGSVACLVPHLFVSPVLLSVLWLFAKPRCLCFMDNAGVSWAFSLFSHISLAIRLRARLWLWLIINTFVGWASLELRSTIKVHVLFCEQFYGHVVNGVNLHFKYDGLK